MATPFLQVPRPKLRVTLTTPCPSQVCLPASMLSCPSTAHPSNLPCLLAGLLHSPACSLSICLQPPLSILHQQPEGASGNISWILTPLLKSLRWLPVSESKAESCPQPCRLPWSGSNPSGLTHHPLPRVQPSGAPCLLLTCARQPPTPRASALAAPASPPPALSKAS